MQKDTEHILVIGFVWPEPTSSAAGKRMLQLISLFQKEGWKVTFASSAAKTKQTAALGDIGVDQVSIKINNSSFDDFLKELNPSVVLFDRFVIEEQFGWRVAEHCPDALRILDTEDLHFLRRVRQQCINKSQELTEKDLLSSKDAKREIASIYRSDLSLIISETEMDLLKNTFGVQPELLEYIPFLVDSIADNQKQTLPDYEERKHFMTIGNFQHDPNMDAIRYLKKEVWPLIRNKLPEAQLHIYGAYPSQEAKQMHKPEEGFLVKGRAENAREVVAEGKVLLAPLRFGAGLKGKLIEAMQCGTPTVTTDVGAEGLSSDTLEWGGKVANNPKAFAKAAHKLFCDKKSWYNAQKRGFEILNTKFREPDFGKELIFKINQLLEHREEHRTQNFTGQMLMHHTAASSKFMARWIEAKNKNR